MRRKLCIGFYCTGIVTAAVLFTLYCLVFVETELEESTRRGQLIEKRYLAPDVNLPTIFIYKPGRMEMVKKEENTIFYRNTVERDILNLPWVLELRKIVEKLDKSMTPQVNLVIADSRSIELLLNWLVVAMVRLPRPLNNVVVLGLDIEVCEILTTRNIRCIHSNPKSFIRHSWDRDFKFLSVYSAPQTRLLAARLINYWGYSFASYDTDALVLRDPQLLYDKHSGVDVIAGAAMHWPDWASGRWGFSMCLGAMMIRSGPATEMLWREVSRSWGEWGSEQDQFNRALLSLVTWNITSPNNSQSQFCSYGNGQSGLSQEVEKELRILLLPQSKICRGECCDSDKYSLSHDPFIYHGGGANIGRFADKINHMIEKGVWFLRADWKLSIQSSSEKGKNWLKLISTL